MENYFYLNAQNEQKGPLAGEELVKNGVTKNTLVWKDGMPQWQPAGDIPELKSLFEEAAIPPAPPIPPVTPPEPPKSTTQAQKPDNFLVWSILATILCCLPFGIVAIVYSAKVDNLWSTGKYEEAEKAARTAKTFFFVSLGVGIFSYIAAIFSGLIGVLAGV